MKEKCDQKQCNKKGFYKTAENWEVIEYPREKYKRYFIGTIFIVAIIIIGYLLTRSQSIGMIP